MNTFYDVQELGPFGKSLEKRASYHKEKNVNPLFHELNFSDTNKENQE
jgi:hypothetical protein